jgi:tRNA(fMet)-specific endonuclease VapC
MSVNYLLDTNIISHMMRNAEGTASRYLEKLINSDPDHKFFTSIVVQSELLFGLAKRPTPKLQQAYERQMAGLMVMPIDDAVSHRYAAVRLALSQAGTPIGPNDLFIAAHALALDCTLVTDNEDEFRRVAGLKVENWSKPEHPHP